MNARWREALAQVLLREWFGSTPHPLARVLRPVAWLYGGLQALRRWAYRSGVKRSWRAPVPVLVVGNLVAGGAGKTPTTLALVKALQQRGWTPGIVSRGHGRSARAPLRVQADSSTADVGDEPLLLHLRSGVPVAVAARRALAAQMLLAAHPEVDLLVADDGLQHWALARDVECILVDERGLGNGRLLPAGPLRERPPAPWGPHQHLLRNGGAATLGAPASVDIQRHLAAPQTLADWWRLSASAASKANGSTEDAAAAAWQHLRQANAVVAAAGTAVPERFFAMLRQQGVQAIELPLPDHFAWPAQAPWPWPTGSQHLLVTEKDAVKLRALAGRSDLPSIWVLPLDLALPSAWLDHLHLQLKAARP